MTTPQEVTLKQITIITNSNHLEQEITKKQTVFFYQTFNFSQQSTECTKCTWHKFCLLIGKKGFDFGLKFMNLYDFHFILFQIAEMNEGKDLRNFKFNYKLPNYTFVKQVI